MSGNIIYVYDWNGENLCQYELDMNLQNICIDKTGKTSNSENFITKSFSNCPL